MWGSDSADPLWTDDAVNGVMIAIAELLTLVCFAAKRGENWRDKFVVYIGDNTNAVGWINRRRTGSRYARFSLRLLGQLEVVYGFRVVSAYIRSHNNVTPDDLTRVSVPEALALLDVGVQHLHKPRRRAADQLDEARRQRRLQQGEVRVGGVPHHE